MEFLISAGADINAGSDQALARAESRKVCEWLLAHGANVNPTGPLPLNFACNGINLKGVKFLLAHGADPNACGESGVPLEQAFSSIYRSFLRARADQIAVIEMLIEAGAKYSDDAVLAIRRGRLGDLQRHLDANPNLVHGRFENVSVWEDPFAPVNRGTLLHVAAEYDEFECAKVLIERDADVNARVERKNGRGSTPIFNVVAQNICSPLLEYCIEQGTDLTLKASFDRIWCVSEVPCEFTPLGFAIAVSSCEWHFMPEETRKKIEILHKHGALE